MRVMEFFQITKAFFCQIQSRIFYECAGGTFQYNCSILGLKFQSFKMALWKWFKWIVCFISSLLKLYDSFMSATHQI